MSEIKESRRVKMTKILLKESLIELMKEKSIHTISIKDICDGADINRSTFYRHYNTQYELYDDIVQELVFNIGEIYEQVKNEGYKANIFLTRIFEYIESKREIFLIVLSDKGNIGVGEAYTKIISNFIDTESYPELSVYVVNFIAAGMTSFLWNWLNQENRRPAAEVAMLMSSLMRHGLGRGIDYHPEKN